MRGVCLNMQRYLRIQLSAREINMLSVQFLIADNKIGQFTRTDFANLCLLPKFLCRNACLRKGSPLLRSRIPRPFCMQSYKFVADPAIVPSASLATQFCRNTSCPPRVYWPSGHATAAQRIGNEAKFYPGNSLNAMRTALGWMCWPSQISSATTFSRSEPAPMGPGLR